ncbi:hypothetical protein [Nocardioides marmotae]|uniref:Uncharacterized protein n=1 Tax=Nocardioides marmotae TaxID=2663857 RepID=A0A6I3JBY4_9ACTN|nr:hypothetical protein [Nocardioides marmotae]MCR6031951.1 hypothetical protein [Gordonia jinghuaiqii]MBC9732108.1 hypothetical protein [Nocardioides marmotae]MTB83229.1 hypothetical protein [Nocardioides marmotae]MTB95591.1 hypothetical protein [Nocardioides marmotae]QKE01010.1 hypothetical protein HPC71_07945 [Nocardioides marmotae]
MTPQNTTASATTDRPVAVRRAVRLLWVLVGLAVLTTVLGVLLRDELLDSWSAGHPVAADIQQPAFVPVAVVLLIVFVCLVATLIPFFLVGTGWARQSLAATVVMAALATVAGLRTDPPAPFVVAAVVSLVVDVAILVLLWSPATNAYVRGRDTSAS